jgi:hypothetical protein
MKMFVKYSSSPTFVPVAIALASSATMLLPIAHAADLPGLDPTNIVDPPVYVRDRSDLHPILTFSDRHNGFAYSVVIQPRIIWQDGEFAHDVTYSGGSWNSWLNKVGEEALCRFEQSNCADGSVPVHVRVSEVPGDASEFAPSGTRPLTVEHDVHKIIASVIQSHGSLADQLPTEAHSATELNLYLVFEKHQHRNSDK